jgi:hypothetical protein
VQRLNGTGRREFDSFYGVDFSGAKQAGRNIWIARRDPVRRGPKGRGRLQLTEISSLEQLSGSADRAPALAHLVELIKASTQSLWALDFPFALPLEIMPAKSSWLDHLALLRAANDDAYQVGLDCLERARALGGPLHIRRHTDVEAKTPFDCYHYRIIYQLFHGVRDVLGPLWRARGTAIVPFQYARLPSASRVLVEACPGSTLKRFGLPHQNYKQPAGGPLTARRRKTRQTILDALGRHVQFDDAMRRTMMRNPGGDAIDAVLAAVGGAQSWHTTDHAAVACHPRYPREGRLYV